jgi:hypothetical protein
MALGPPTEDATINSPLRRARLCGIIATVLICAATSGLRAQNFDTVQVRAVPVPGHGPLADRARLQAYHDMLVVMRDRMRREAAAKHTVEQVLASKITAEYDASWPGARERFLRIRYQELSAR